VRLALVACFAVACGGKSPPLPPPPGGPIVASPDLQLDTMDAECNGLISAFEAWKQCPNLEDEQKTYVENLIERAHLDYAAAQKSQPDERAQKEIARRCRRAASSVKAATERCRNGRPPKAD
jgi:hypothetical protein